MPNESADSGSLHIDHETVDQAAISADADRETALPPSGPLWSIVQNVTYTDCRHHSNKENMVPLGDNMSSQMMASAAHERASPQLWDFYERLVAKLEGERTFVLAQIENLRVPVEDAHRIEWESRQRITEIQDLKAQLQAAEKKLSDTQEKLVGVSQDTDKLREQAPKWAADLERLRAIVCPRFDGVRYSAGAQPEKIGRFVPSVPSQAGNPHASGTASHSSQEDAARTQMYANSGPTLVEYLPYDREDATGNHLKDLHERLAEERQGHAAARQALQELDQLEEEENQLLVSSLRQSLARIQKHRTRITSSLDDVVSWHLKLQMSHEDLQTKGRTELEQLLKCNTSLSQRLQALAAHNHKEIDAAVIEGRKLKEKASSAHMDGMFQAREETSRLQSETDEAQARSLRNVEGLERQLTVLRNRYKGLANHRTAEFAVLQQDIQRLQHAVRQCEKLATYCVGAESSSARPQRAEAGGPADSLDTPEALGALALGPAVRRLRKVLERCEQKLGEERCHHNTTDDQGSPGVIGDLHDSAPRTSNVAGRMQPLGSGPSSPPVLQ